MFQPSDTVLERNLPEIVKESERGCSSAGKREERRGNALTQSRNPQDGRARDESVAGWAQCGASWKCQGRARAPPRSRRARAGRTGNDRDKVTTLRNAHGQRRTGIDETRRARRRGGRGWGGEREGRYRGARPAATPAETTSRGCITRGGRRINNQYPTFSILGLWPRGLHSVTPSSHPPQLPARANPRPVSIRRQVPISGEALVSSADLV